MSEFPSVTRILEAVGLSDFSHVPAETLAAAQARGTAVHAALEAAFYGYEPDVDVTPYLGYLEAHERFVKDSGYQAEAMEFEVIHVAQQYIGHPDSRGWLHATRGIVDYKTGALGPIAYQLGGYRAAWNHLFPSLPVDWIAGVELREDGTYRFHEVEPAEAEAKWYSALTVYRDQPR